MVLLAHSPYVYRFIAWTNRTSQFSVWVRQVAQTGLTQTGVHQVYIQETEKLLRGNFTTVIPHLLLSLSPEKTEISLT